MADWKCRLMGHNYVFLRINPYNRLCLRCGWFEHGPNPNYHTKLKER